MAANLPSQQEAGGSSSSQMLCTDFQAGLGYLTPCFVKPLPGAGEVAKLKEQLSSRQEVLDPIPSTTPVIPTLRGWKQEDQKFMVILGYRLS